MTDTLAIPTSVSMDQKISSSEGPNRAVEAANFDARQHLAHLWNSFSETGEGEMARNRLVISLLILSYFLIEWGLNGRPLVTPVATISTFALFSALHAAHVLCSPAENGARRVIAMCADLGTLSFGLYIGGEITACTWPIYLWVIYGNGFRFGEKYLMVSAATAALMFVAVIMVTPFWIEFHNLAYGLLFGLIVLPLYARKLIRDLSIARREAEEANRAKSLFLASVSHELRTPLNAIIGLSEVLISSRLTDEQREMLSTVNTSGRTLCHLIENILDFSRLESGAMPTQAKEFHLPTLVAEICSVAKAQTADKPVHVNAHVMPGVPRMAVADSLKLTQILTNFMSNAVKFTDEGNVTLAVNARRLDTKRFVLRFAVSDTGMGISADGQTRIFERFTQENDKIVDRFGGTGLGLAIVKQTAELLGGNVGVESTQGEGSVFWCEIPVTEASKFLALPAPSKAELAIFMEAKETSDRVMKSVAGHPVTVLCTDHELSAWAGRQNDGRTTRLLFVDANSQTQASQIINDADDSRLRLVRVRKSRRGPDQERVIAHQSIGQVQLKSLKRDLMPLIQWIEDLSDKKHPAHASEACTYDPLSILIAEDNAANQLVIRKILEKVGHDMTIVSNGEEALAQLADKSFDVILLDLNMPVMNGFEALKFMRFALHDENVPIIALTADATTETAERCRDCGFDAVLTKPYRSKDLLKTLQKHGKADSPSIGATISQGPVGTAAETAPINEADRIVPSDIPALPDVLDVQQLEEVKALGGSEFLADIVGQFERTCERHLVLLHRAAKAQQTEDIRKLAHAIKSCALNLGASRMVMYCTRLEDDTDLADPTAVQALMRSIADAFDDSVAALEQYMAFLETEPEPPAVELTYH
jgi:two-component system, sensor histidine kinase RpfC